MISFGFEFAAVSKAAAREYIDDQFDVPDVVKALVKTAISKCSEPGTGRHLLVSCSGHWPGDGEYSGRSEMRLETRHIRTVG